jgi:hypothetical protein
MHVLIKDKPMSIPAKNILRRCNLVKSRKIELKT